MAHALPAATGPARLTRSADFERVLRARSRVRSAHFAIHHVADWPASRSRTAEQAASYKLSTSESTASAQLVDDLPAAAPALPLWLGAVVPKRHARRAVTRTLLKRQIRAAVSERRAALAGGLWVVRLCAPFERTQFPSAASAALARAVRTELEGLLRQAAGRCAVARTRADAAP
ncbi:MAG: ribonuclease P protein component [Proteobacteria bacterium]|nr:ribonuclease P protein component [Pseudomonadota bacterium]